MKTIYGSLLVLAGLVTSATSAAELKGKVDNIHAKDNIIVVDDQAFVLTPRTQFRGKGGDRMVGVGSIPIGAWVSLESDLVGEFRYAKVLRLIDPVPVDEFGNRIVDDE